MPVTLTVADHAARRWGAINATSDIDLLRWVCPREFGKSKEVIQSSFSRSLLRQNHISPSGNGFVFACFYAYSYHHHLTLRPEDIWFAILSQIGFFVKAHAEELRHLFVEHEGQKELEVIDVGSKESADFGIMAQRMTMVIQKNVLDPDLRTWIMPHFSTTTDSDRIVASVLMMGAIENYFSYGFTLTCGIPSVTLLGEKADWEELLGRLPRLEQLGTEPSQFARLLQPILHKIIQSFDEPDSPSVNDFWSKFAHKTAGGSGPEYLSGWLTAFCFWDQTGKSFFHNSAHPPVTQSPYSGCSAGCELEGVYYHKVDFTDIPPGYTSVPVTVNDNGNVFKTRMVAGSVGISGTSTGDMLDESHDHKTRDRRTRSENGWTPYVYTPTAPTGKPGLDSVQPVSGWWMYELTTDAQDAEGRTETNLETARSADDEILQVSQIPVANLLAPTADSVFDPATTVHT